MSDECFKMALTDAISVAAKAIGIGADVYWEKDKTKYTNPNTDDLPFEEKKPRKKTVKEEPIICSDCGAELTGYTGSNGKFYTARDQERYTVNSFGRTLCLDCWKKATAVNQNATGAYDSEGST